MIRVFKDRVLYSKALKSETLVWRYRSVSDRSLAQHVGGGALHSTPSDTHKHTLLNACTYLSVH